MDKVDHLAVLTRILRETEQLAKTCECGVCPREIESLTWVIARIESLESENAALQLKADRLQTALDDRVAAHAADHTKLEALMLTKFVRFNNEDCWLWQGDGTDELDSLTCPVVIAPSELKAVVNELAALRAELAARGPVLSEDEIDALKNAEHAATYEASQMKDMSKGSDLAATVCKSRADHLTRTAYILRNLLERAKR